jgi:chaperonin GroES
MKFKPLHDRIIVSRIEAEEKTEGGIIIPDTAKEKPQEGRIIAAGPGRYDEDGKRVPLEVRPETGSYSPAGPERKSRLTAKNT